MGKSSFIEKNNEKKRTFIDLYVISKRHYFQFDGRTNVAKGNFDN